MKGIVVDTEALALADQIIIDYDLVSIKRPFPVPRAELRIALGYKLHQFAESRKIKTPVRLESDELTSKELTKDILEASLLDDIENA